MPSDAEDGSLAPGCPAATALGLKASSRKEQAKHKNPKGGLGRPGRPGGQGPQRSRSQVSGFAGILRVFLEISLEF